MDEVEAKVRKAGRLAGEARDYGLSLIAEGGLLMDVADKVEGHIRNNGGVPGFPVNIAVNTIAAHYTPKKDDDLVFERGDVVKLDVGACVDGYLGDTAATVEVGTKNWTRMIEASRQGLEVAIEMMRPGVDLNVVGASIERTIRAAGFVPIENLTGHSMERYNLHAGLSVPNVGNSAVTGTVKVGDVVAIEPFATNGHGSVGGRKPSNIYRLVRKREVRSEEAEAFMLAIDESYGGLPFAERWCWQHTPKPGQLLRRLIRIGCVSSYPILKEVGNGIVTQAEHTVLIKDDGCEILT